MARSKTGEAKFNKENHPTFKKIKNRSKKFLDASTEIINQHREFKVTREDGNEKPIRILPPSPKTESIVSEKYSKIYGKLLEDSDVKTEDEILSLMEKRKIWDNNKTKRLEGLQERITRLTSQLLFKYEAMTKDEFLKICEDYEESSKEFEKLNELKWKYTQNSLEARCNEIKIKEQIWRCVFWVEKENNETKLVPIWNSFEELDNEIDKILVFRVMTEAVTFWQGVPANFLEDLPESENGETDILPVE